MTSSEDRSQAECEFRQLRDVLPQYICVYGSDGTPLYANDELLEFFGFTLDDFRADVRTRCLEGKVGRLRRGFSGRMVNFAGF